MNGSLAPTLQAFFTERLINQRHASANTVAAYRDAWRLLLRYANDRIGKQPCQLDITDLNAAFIAAFLAYLGSCRCDRSRCPAPSCSTLRGTGGPSSTPWSRTTWIWVGPSRLS